jgi:NAD(P)-dependent dehydrogenase (short-subunit alcohol dehydrogenase family)
MSGRYVDAHKYPQGPDDARPSALQIVKDEGLEGKMTDKVFIVTGASSGIGIETGRALAATGGKVFLGVRNVKKGEDACKAYLEPGRVELLEMDLESLDSVRAAAKNFLSKSTKLNVIVNNAGVMATPQGKTKDGFETQFGTNHLAHFLFFNLLKDTLIASSTPEFNSRVVCVSSSGHRGGGVHFDDYGLEKGEYNPWVSYSQSKTANIYMASEIENRYGSQGLHGISLHPGGIWTPLQKHMSEERLKAMKSAPGVDKIIKSPAQGAATSIYAAIGKEWEGKGRIFLEDCAQPGPLVDYNDYSQAGYAAHAFDKEKEAKLWEDSLKMVGLA